MNFGGSGISESMYKWIKDHLPSGSHILELGSGDVSTKYLSELYRLTSVEDKAEFLNRHPSHYIHAPLVNGWFDTAVLETQLPRDYDLILVDGPVGSEPRAGFIKNLGLFKTNVPIIVDDTWREVEKQMAVDLAVELGGELIVDEFWSVIVPNQPDCSARSGQGAAIQNPTPPPDPDCSPECPAPPDSPRPHSESLPPCP